MGNRTNPIYHFLSSSVSSPQKIFLIPLKNGSSVSPHGSEEAKKEMSKKQVEQRTKERRGENWTSQDRPARPSLPRVAASALAGAPQLCVRPGTNLEQSRSADRCNCIGIYTIASTFTLPQSCLYKSTIKQIQFGPFIIC